MGDFLVGQMLAIETSFWFAFKLSFNLTVNITVLFWQTIYISKANLVVFVSGNFHLKNNFLKNSTFIEFSAKQKSMHSAAANTKLINGDGEKMKNWKTKKLKNFCLKVTFELFLVPYFLFLSTYRETKKMFWFFVESSGVVLAKITSCQFFAS